VTALDLDGKDLEQLDMLKVKQKIEKENLMNAAEKEIEDSADLDKLRPRPSSAKLLHVACWWRYQRRHRPWRNG
jgi:hypothetical protein